MMEYRNMVCFNGLQPIENKGGKILIPIAPKQCGVSSMIMGKVILKQGEELKSHVHDYGEEAFIVISGKGKAIIGNNEYDFGEEAAYFVPKGVEHKIINTCCEKLEIIFASSPLASDPKAGDRITEGCHINTEK